MRFETIKQQSRRRYTDAIIVFALFLLGFTWLGCEPKPDAEIQADPVPETSSTVELYVDQEAVNLLKRGLNYLSSLDKFNVATQQTLEDVIDNMYRIDFETSADLTVSRPDKIRVERFGFYIHQLLFFDGKVFTLQNPNDKVYASEPLTGNLEDMFHAVRDKFGINASSADLIYPNAFSLLTQNVVGAEIVGKEMIGEVTCDHLLFIRPDVSYQIWISENEPYLPYKYVVTDTSTPHLLSSSTLMTKWDLSPEISDSMFRYSPAEDENQIVFMNMTESVEKSID